MEDNRIIELAAEEGFFAVMTTPDQIPVDGKFRVFCEENRCGKYNANYSCPPDCGTVEELHEKLMAEEKALVLQSIWEIEGYEDTETVQKAKKSHNGAALRLMDRLKKCGYDGFCSGYNGCPLCEPCKRVENLPCAHPDKKISCLSAYCVDVAELAKRCNLKFAWSSEKLYLFGIIAFHEAVKR